MEKYVQAYLNNNIEIRKSSVGNDGVYLIGDKSRYSKPVYYIKLIYKQCQINIILLLKIDCK
jgi:hypothetical protein